MNKKKPLLILLPFAGGNAYSYKAMVPFLESTYEVVTPELPGRGKLSNKNLLETMDMLVEYLFRNVIQSLDLNRQYVLYGHSMGALLVYLLGHKIKKTDLPQPVHLIVSGRNAPHFKKKTNIHHLPSTEFWKSLKEMGGVPDELLDHQELKEYFEPILRNDFKLVENYHYNPTQYKLDLPMTVIYGDKEDMSKDSIYAWQQENKQTVHFVEMQGSHFFIFNHVLEIAEYIKSAVQS